MSDFDQSRGPSKIEQKDQVSGRSNKKKDTSSDKDFAEVIVTITSNEDLEDVTMRKVSPADLP